MSVLDVFQDHVDAIRVSSMRLVRRYQTRWFSSSKKTFRGEAEPVAVGVTSRRRAMRMEERRRMEEMTSRIWSRECGDHD